MNENVNETAETVETEVQPVVEPAALTAAMDEFMLARYGVAPLADDAGDTDALAAAIEPVASAPMMANALSAGATTGTTKPTYTPHEWVNGADGGTLPLNAANLNEIEAGISGNCEAIGSIIDDVNELRDSQSQFDIYGISKIEIGVGQGAWINLIATDGRKYTAQLTEFE